MVNMSNGDTVDSFGNKFDLVSINVFDNHNSFFGQKMQRKLVSSVSQNTFLDQNNISTRFGNFFDQVHDIISFFFEDSVHSVIFVNNN